MQPICFSFIFHHCPISDLITTRHPTAHATCTTGRGTIVLETTGQKCCQMSPTNKHKKNNFSHSIWNPCWLNRDAKIKWQNVIPNTSTLRTSWNPKPWNMQVLNPEYMGFKTANIWVLSRLWVPMAGTLTLLNFLKFLALNVALLRETIHVHEKKTGYKVSIPILCLYKN